MKLLHFLNAAPLVKKINHLTNLKDQINESDDIFKFSHAIMSLEGWENLKLDGLKKNLSIQIDNLISESQQELDKI